MEAYAALAPPSNPEAGWWEMENSIGACRRLRADKGL